MQTKMLMKRNSKVTAVSKEIPTLPDAKRRSRDFYDCFKLMYITSRSFGQLPFTIHVDSSGYIERASVGVFDAVWFVGCIVVNSALLYLTVFAPKKYSDIGSLLVKLSDTVCALCSFGIWFSSTIWDMINRKRFARILQHFNAFDKEVRNDKVS